MEKNNVGTQYASPNVDVYRGEWANNQMHGRGVLTTSAGVCYDGEFESGLKCDHGELKCDGDTYIAQLVSRIHHRSTHVISDGHDSNYVINQAIKNDRVICC